MPALALLEACEKLVINMNDAVLTKLVIRLVEICNLDGIGENDTE